MENFTKNSLKAAVKTYGPLHSNGKTDAEVKAALKADEKGYSDEQVDDIYAAIIAPPTKPSSYKVVEGKSFRDKDNFAIEYIDKSDISGLSQDRIDHLVSIGYVEEA